MKQKTEILQSMAMLKQIENGFSEFENMLIESDNDPRTPHAKVFLYLVNADENYKNTAKEKRVAFKEAFGSSEKYSVGKINTMLKQLCRWINQFVVVKRGQEHGYDEKVKADIFRDLGLFKQMEQAMEALLNKALSADAETKYYLTSEVLHDQYFYGDGDRHEPDYQDIFKRCNEAFDNFVLKRKLKLISEQYYISRFKGEAIGEQLKRDQRIFFELIPRKPPVSILLQALAIKYFMAQTHEAYYEFKNAFYNNYHLLSSGKKYLLIQLVNALLVIKPKFNKVMNEHLELFELGFERKIFLEDGQLHYKIFNNFVFILMYFEKYEAMRKFVDTHAHLIKNTKERDKATQMADCCLLFGDGKYFTALRELDLFKGTYPVFNLRKYNLKLKCTYDFAKDKYDAFNEIKKIGSSYKRLLLNYLNEGHINQKYYDAILNFLTFLNKISNTWSKERSKESIRALVDSFEGVLPEVSWIERKIAELD